MTSMLLSRNRMVRDKGSSKGSTLAICVVRERSWLSPLIPTTDTLSPGVRSRGVSFADLTGVFPSNLGS